MNTRPTPRRLRTGVFALAACLASVAPLVAQDAPPAEAAGADMATDAWSPALSMRFRAVGQTAISPDGSNVAFTVREPLMEGEQSEYLTHVWVAGADGSGARQYTRGEASASSPSFSPDGAWLLFTTRREDGPGEHADETQVWALPMAGGEAVQVTDAPEGVGNYALAPDGEHLAYTMRDAPSEEWEEARLEKRDVVVADTDFRHTHLYMGPFRTGGEPMDHSHPLTSGDFTVTGFDWAPDGSWVAFTHQPDPRINTGRLAGDLSVVFTAHEGEGDHDFETRDLVTGGGVEGQPKAAPDGRHIAFTSTGHDIEPVGLSDVYVVDLDGGEPRPLAHTWDRSASIAGWSADGAHLFVQETVGTTRHLQVLPADGGPGRMITSGNGVVGGLSMTPDTRTMAFTWQTPDTPWNVYVSPVSLDGPPIAEVDTDAQALGDAGWSPRAITDLHAGVPLPEMGRTELLTWRSQDGRFEIEGLLTYPVDYRAGDRVPLVLSVHGGPAGAYTQGFTGGPSIYMTQTFAQEGYAVLRPNPRGSTGYGRDFRYANVRDWGYGDMDDLMAGVDRVVEMGVADGDQLYLMGWSYGGYMTSFAVTRTDRFRAASMGAGLPNLISMTTTTDIGDYLVGHMGAEFWDDYDVYEKHSAMYRIADVTTPTQVIHGENDLRVPFTQGQEFYRALQRLGVDTEMLILPRTPHGPREPKLLMEVTTRILDWFEKHAPRQGVVSPVPAP